MLSSFSSIFLISSSYYYHYFLLSLFSLLYAQSVSNNWSPYWASITGRQSSPSNVSLIKYKTLGFEVRSSKSFFPASVLKSRARNNGQSIDNVQTDWGVDRSEPFIFPVMLTGHIRSGLYWKWNKLKFPCCSVVSVIISMWRVAVYCRTLIWNPGWNATRTIVYN